MPSWRDQTSATAQRALDIMLDAALTAAGQAVQDAGTFYPFGVVVASDGAMSLVGAAEPAEVSDADAVVGELWGILRDQRDDLEAAAVVTDRLSGTQDQIGVQVEHREGVALEITLAYDAAPGSFQPGEIRASAGVARVW